MTTFTEKELDALWDNYCEAGNANGSTENGEIDLYDIDGMFGAAAEMRDAITYLRAQLSERDPIGAVIMRERAAMELDSDVADLQADASRFRSGTDPHHGRMAFAEAAKRQAGRIRSIPLPTPAETLAYALQLPEVKALVNAARPYVATVNNADFGRQMREHDALTAALAQMEGKE